MDQQTVAAPAVANSAIRNVTCTFPRATRGVRNGPERVGLCEMENGATAVLCVLSEEWGKYERLNGVFDPGRWPQQQKTIVE